MKTTSTLIPYAETGAFKPLVLDYLAKADFLSSFYQHPVSIEGIENAIQLKQASFTNRQLLVEQLHLQYAGLPLSESQSANLKKLENDNCFTITTAHQPNILTGPTYFIYKIFHAIKLCTKLQEQLPNQAFVPVYYMGSEDADLDELGTFTVDGKTYKWNTTQTGAVGRMLVDNALLQLIEQLQKQIGVLPFGYQLIEIFASAYTLGKTIQQATLELVNLLFADYGLLVLIPDNPALKKAFEPVILEELQTGFSQKAATETIQQLEKAYKIQAGGRAINLFYLIDDHRERIEKSEEGLFEVKKLHLRWTESEIVEEVYAHPERFSPNVMLRGLFQETILPNIAFVGGGGELSYWLELKGIFDAVHMPYPMLILRNSFLFVNDKQQQLLRKAGIQHKDLFHSASTIFTNQLTSNQQVDLLLTQEIEALKKVYQQMQTKASAIDPTLGVHTDALATKAIKKINDLQKKILAAEKRKHQDVARQIAFAKQQIFPNNQLQERVENMSLWYAHYGKDWLNAILEHSLSLEQQFAIVHIH